MYTYGETRPRSALIDSRFKHNPDCLVDIRALPAYTLIEASRNIFRQTVDVETSTGRRLADLETLVSNLPAQQASDPRDTIYAVLAISSDAPPGLFDVDYRKTSTQVFKDFIDFCVNKSKSLDVICKHWAPEPEKRLQREETLRTPQTLSSSRKLRPPGEALPSWVPRVSGLPFGPRGRNRSGRINGDSLVGTPNRKFYNASRGTSGKVIFGKSEVGGHGNDGYDGLEWIDLDGSITVSGFQIDEIVALGPRSSDGSILVDWVQMGEWEENYNVPEYFWRTLVADRGPHGIPTPAWYHRACLYCLEQSGGGDITLSQMMMDNCPSMAADFLTRVQNVIWNRKFFRTSDLPGEGYFGLAPPKTEKGDVISILYGCSVPVVLRRLKRFIGAWELIGECFVYGMMDGEAMAADQNRNPQEFELR